MGCFLLGAFTTVTSCLRMYQNIFVARSGDLTMLVLWGNIEINTGIILTCIPVLAPLFHYFRDRDIFPSSNISRSSRRVSSRNNENNSRNSNLNGQPLSNLHPFTTTSISTTAISPITTPSKSYIPGSPRSLASPLTRPSPSPSYLSYDFPSRNISTIFSEGSGSGSGSDDEEINLKTILGQPEPNKRTRDEGREGGGEDSGSCWEFDGCEFGS